MKLYLAHPLDLRAQIREIELEIERTTGVELHNPFYDSDRDDIYDIDAGKMRRTDKSLDFKAIVEGDLSNIDESDGLVAYIERGIHSIGTMFELWNTSMLHADKEIFVVSPDSLNHPWIRYLLDYSGGQGFTNWDDFIKWILELQRFYDKLDGERRKNTCGGE
uniref:Nucleoside deoxyribosyltransferase n=1 Tax=viral metagenome TaxID=1070528 RepID=A0A6M3KE59_9ZZZZ